MLKKVIFSCVWEGSCVGDWIGKLTDEQLEKIGVINDMSKTKKSDFKTNLVIIFN